MWNRYTGTGESESDYAEVLERATKRGNQICVLAPLLLIGAIHLLRMAGITTPQGETPAIYDLLLMIFIALGVAEVAAAFFLRRSLFAPARFEPMRADHGRVADEIMRASTVVATVGAGPILYGAILYLMGGEVRDVVYFGLLNLLGFRLLRPDVFLLEKALGGPLNPSH
jgi:hypothetical protein